MNFMSTWQEKNDALFREFNFKDFNEAFAFMGAVAAEAEQRQHHPRWENEYNTVKIWLTTHDKGNKVTEKDHSFSQAIDAIFKGGEAVEETAKPAGKYKTVKMFSDGGSRGNPGPSASGYVLLDENDDVILKSGVYLGITTNNQAEYRSLLFGLEEAKKLGAREVDVYMDSLLVVNQMTGKFKVKNRDLWPIYEEIKKLSNEFKKVSFSHVPRELNKLADAEVNEVLDAEAKK